MLFRSVRLAPRFGLAWNPGGSDKTVVRAGFGLFFNQWAYSVQTGLMQNLPFFFNKNVTVAADAQRPAFSTANILQAPATGTIGGNGMDQKYRSEYAESWTLSLQRALRRDWIVEANYFGSKVVGADDTTFYNIPAPGPGPIAARRPNPNLSALQIIHWGGYSNYNALSVKLEKRLSHRVSVNANYTWSKSMDVASSPGPTFSEANFPQDVRFRRAEKAPSSFDHRHRLALSFNYDLPGGVSILGFGTFQTGAPFTVNIPTDNANIGAGPAQRPDMTCDPNVRAPRTAREWFNTSCFSLPAPFTFGTAPRNGVRAPGYANLDLALAKALTFDGGARIELRWEVFNALNRANFDVPSRIYGTANFGRILSAGPARQMQVGARLSF